MNKKILLPPEWHPQSALQIAWPDEKTDWKHTLRQVERLYVTLAAHIVKRQKLIIVCRNENNVKQQLQNLDLSKIIFRTIHCNDTWARDHAGITVFINGNPVIYDFVFNGWGMKYPANLDNLITRKLAASKTFSENVRIISKQPFILEGGSIESDGKGAIMTTLRCLTSPNRNEHLSKKQIQRRLKNLFGTEKILWLENGFLQGDDTDSHIDTLARFCSENAIAYVKCIDSADEHFHALKAMEEELKTFRNTSGQPYNLIPLPMADPVTDPEEKKRLPATYANFLIINGAIIMPLYLSPKDNIAKQTLQKAFPGKEIIGIDARPLIRQHGSLHCIAMQYPEGVVP